MCSSDDSLYRVGEAMSDGLVNLLADHGDVLAERDRLQAENRRLNEALDGLEKAWSNVHFAHPSFGTYQLLVHELREARAAIQPQREGEDR